MKAGAPVILTQLAAQRARGEAPAAIFTDLDGTFVVEGDAASAQAADELFHWALGRHIPMIAMTGRDTARLRRELKGGTLPAFTAVIGAVGTEILLRSADGQYQEDESYNQKLATQFSRAEVLQRAQELLRTLPPSATFRLQHKQKDERFKISLCFAAASPAEAMALTEPFRQAFPKLKIIVCSEIYDTSQKGSQHTYNLDIVPAGKSDAIQYLMRTYGIEGGLVAGDSGNDVEALLLPGLDAVLVDGHTAEARAALQNAPKSIFIDTNPSRRGAQSILHRLRISDVYPLRRHVPAASRTTGLRRSTHPKSARPEDH